MPPFKSKSGDADFDRVFNGEEGMRQQLLDELMQISEEESKYKAGQAAIEEQLYSEASIQEIDRQKLLRRGKLITVRRHSRFVEFPLHRHNYVEMIYMCRGQTHHVINGEDVYLHQGELLLLSQNAVQEIYPAGKEDIAVNFIILPEFFEDCLKMIASEENTLRNFVIHCLRGENDSSGYLHFKVAEVLPIQNLIENLIFTISNKQPNKRSINQVTMGLLFLLLMNQMETDTESEFRKFVMQILGYVEEHYRDGELSQLAEDMHYDVYWLSKEIRKRTGRTYTELVQDKRLRQAAYLLKNTAIPVSDVAMKVGYSNISYFHRLFYKRYGVTPKKYRDGK